MFVGAGYLPLVLLSLHSLTSCLHLSPLTSDPALPLPLTSDTALLTSSLAHLLSITPHPSSQVLLIGHVPPGDLDNLPEYGQYYLNITRHYKDTIVGHLFGHTHMDHFELVGTQAASAVTNQLARYTT